MASSALTLSATDFSPASYWMKFGWLGLELTGRDMTNFDHALVADQRAGVGHFRLLRDIQHWQRNLTASQSVSATDGDVQTFDLSPSPSLLSELKLFLQIRAD